MQTVDQRFSLLPIRAVALAASAGLAFGLGGCAATHSGGDARTSSGGGSMVATADAGLIVDIERKSDARTVRIGQPFVYTIDITNTSDQPLANVRLKETTFASEIAMVESEPMASSARAVAVNERPVNADSRNYYPGWSRDVYTTQRTSIQAANSNREKAETVMAELGRDDVETTWDVGDLGPGETRTVSVTAVANKEGAVQSCLTADYDFAVCADPTAIRAVRPDLLVERAPEKRSVYACEDIRLTYTLTNTGSGTTDRITLNERLPEGATRNDSQRLNLSFAPLKPGETRTETVVIQAEELDSFGGFATAKSGNVEVRSKSQTVDIVRPEIELEVDGPSKEYFGRTVSHTVTVTNTSDDPAKDVVIRPMMPSGVERVSSSSRTATTDNKYIAAIPLLQAGESRQVTYTFETDEPRTVSARYSASGYCVDQETATIKTDIVGIPAIRVEVFDTTDPVRVGENVIYKVRVKNQGTADGLDIRLVADVPDNMVFVRAEGDRPASQRRGQVVFEPIPTLAAGEVEEWMVYMNATSPGRTRLELEVSSDATSRPVIEQEPTTVVE